MSIENSLPELVRNALEIAKIPADVKGGANYYTYIFAPSPLTDEQYDSWRDETVKAINTVTAVRFSIFPDTSISFVTSTGKKLEGYGIRLRATSNATSAKRVAPTQTDEEFNTYIVNMVAVRYGSDTANAVDAALSKAMQGKKEQEQLQLFLAATGGDVELAKQMKAMMDAKYKPVALDTVVTPTPPPSPKGKGKKEDKVQE